MHAQQEAWWLVEAASGQSRSELLSGWGSIAETAQLRALELARRRAQGEPLQYVTERAGFRHIDLVVGPGVFIPRPETELVAERAMELLPAHGTAVDVGTGSGAIAISIAVERPDAFVLATESSPEAIAYATRNAARYSATVDFYLCDLMSGLPERLARGVDVCVANLPYVPWSERRALPVDVVDHEPHVALFGEEDGVGTIARLARGARRWVREGGRLVFEIGDRQGEVAEEVLRAAGYRALATSRDLSGRERILEAMR